MLVLGDAANNHRSRSPYRKIAKEITQVVLLLTIFVFSITTSVSHLSLYLINFFVEQDNKTIASVFNDVRV